MSLQPSPAKALHDLLCKLFDQKELLRFVGHYRRDLLPGLPSDSAPLADLAEAVWKALDRRGLLDLSFFSALAEEAPARRGEITAVARAWGVDLSTSRTSCEIPPTSVPAPAAPSSSSRRLPAVLGITALAAIGGLFAAWPWLWPAQTPPIEVQTKPTAVALPPEVAAPEEAGAKAVIAEPEEPAPGEPKPPTTVASPPAPPPAFRSISQTNLDALAKTLDLTGCRRHLLKGAGRKVTFTVGVKRASSEGLAVSVLPTEPKGAADCVQGKFAAALRGKYSGPRSLRPLSVEVTLASL